MYLYKVNNQNQLEDIREKPFKKKKRFRIYLRPIFSKCWGSVL